jgi:diguanylate cyclase (GGDEF)-like protein/PAS domain S-box-containing protein
VSTRLSPAETESLTNRADDLPVSLLADLVNAVTDFVGTINESGEFLFLNPAGRRLLEIPQEEDIRGQSVLPYNELPSEEIQQKMDRVVLAGENEWSGTNVFVSRSGKRIPMSQSVVAHITDGVRYYSTIARNITAQIKAEQDLRWAAERDALTGLLNRSAFRTSVEQQGHRATVLLVLELENFKQVNDTYGHHVGDQVLQRAAWVLADSLGERGIPARLGADEFGAAIFGDTNESPEEIVAGLQSELYRHLSLFDVGVSVGSSPLNLPTDSLDAALQIADLDLFATRKMRHATGWESVGGHRPGMSAQELRRSLRHRR